MRVVSKVALRGLRQRERIEKLAEAAPAGVRVVPSKDEYRPVLKHPNGSGFAASGSAEWPDDRFTKRRLADGSVIRETEQMRAGKEPPRPRQQDKEPSAA